MAVIFCAALLLGAAAADSGTADIFKVERRLYDLGYRDENCDGQMDETTISALRNFQTVNGLPVTGEMDEATVQRLMSDSAIPEDAYLKAFAEQYSESAALVKGAYGDDVKRLQRALKKLGYFSGECNGAYGDGTETAVYSFQLAVGVHANGIADGSTLMRLYAGEAPEWDAFIESATAKPGDSGSGVRMLQMRLKNLGYFQGGCTGVYGEGTQAAVQRFQVANALESSGVANEATCEILYSNRSAVTNATLAADREGLSDSVREMLDELRALHYSAGDTLNAHTEIAVMQFQLLNGIAVTGALDSQTQEMLKSGEASEMNDALEASVSEDQIAQLTRTAESLLGRQMEFQSKMELAQYVYLKSGIPLMNMQKLAFSNTSDGGEIRAGDVVIADIAGAEMCGVATSDGAMIYCGADGFVVMSYLDMLGDDDMMYWRAPAAE